MTPWHGGVVQQNIVMIIDQYDMEFGKKIIWWEKALPCILSYWSHTGRDYSMIHIFYFLFSAYDVNSSC